MTIVEDVAVVVEDQSTCLGLGGMDFSLYAVCHRPFGRFQTPGPAWIGETANVPYSRLLVPIRIIE
jgi:hypothetical protein